MATTGHTHDAGCFAACTQRRRTLNVSIPADGRPPATVARIETTEPTGDLVAHVHGPVLMARMAHRCGHGTITDVRGLTAEQVAEFLDAQRDGSDLA